MRRARDEAAELGISEGELVARGLGTTAIRLDGDAAALLHALPGAGKCMALTRNDHAVSEVRGRYGGVELGAHAGQVLGDAIDLRVFLGQWHALFALTAPRRSIQVFDRTGTAVHKIYAEDADPTAWDALIEAHQIAPVAPSFEPVPPRRTERPDGELDRTALIADWDAMTDTHEFFHLLAKHGATRTQALRLAGEARAREVRASALEHVLHDVAETGDRIMIFVGNRGCIQIYSGPVHRIVRHAGWLNVLDETFNLHLRDDRIATSWVVAKPTRTGVVRSLELFDRDGETIALVFRKRDDRELAEDPAWSELLARLPSGARRRVTEPLGVEESR